MCCIWYNYYLYTVQANIVMKFLYFSYKKIEKKQKQVEEKNKHLKVKKHSESQKLYKNCTCSFRKAKELKKGHKEEPVV